MEGVIKITPEKVKALLSSFIFTPVEESSTPNINRNQNTNSRRSSEFIYRSLTNSRSPVSATRPRDRAAFFDRVNTYTSSTWFAKPASLSPAQCARYGWVNVSKDLLRCVSCRAYLSGQMSTTADPQVYAECCQRLLSSLKSGHKVLCPWSSCPCPESFLLLSLGSHEAAVTNAKTTVGELKTLGEFLPVISQQTWADMDLSENDLNELVKLLVITAEDPGTKVNPDDSSSRFPDDSTLTRDQIKVLLVVCGWNVSGSSKKQLECLHCNRHVGLWSCHSVQTRRLMAEQSRIMETEANDTQAANGGNDDMETDKVMRTNELMSDNNVREKICEMETSEDVNTVVSEILSDIIVSCVSKVEQCQYDSENSTAIVVHPEVNGQLTLESEERDQSGKSDWKDESKEFADADDREVVHSQDDAESIVSEIIEDLLRKCCETRGLNSVDENCTSGDGKVESTPVCNSDAMDDINNEMKTSVENSEDVQLRSSCDDESAEISVQESVILVSGSHQEGDEDVKSIHIINDPADQFVQFGKISDQVISDQCLITDVGTSDGEDDQKIISEMTRSAEEKSPLGTTAMELEQDTSQLTGNDLPGDLPVVEEEYVLDAVCGSEFQEVHLTADTQVSSVPEVNNKVERHEAGQHSDEIDGSDVELTTEMEQTQVTSENTNVSPVREIAFSQDTDVPSAAETMNDVMEEAEESSGMRTSVSDINRDVCPMEEESYNQEVIVGEEEDIIQKSVNGDVEEKLPQVETCLVSDESVNDVMEEAEESSGIRTSVSDINPDVCPVEEESYNQEVIVGEEEDVIQKSVNGDVEEKLPQVETCLVSDESVTSIQDKLGITEGSCASQNIRSDAITEVAVHCSLSEIGNNSICTNDDAKVDNSDKEDSGRTLHDENHKRKIRDDNAVAHDSSQNEMQPPRKKIKSQMTLSYFCPIKEHRSWCPWVTKESVVSANDTAVSRSRDQSKNLPGWKTFVQLLLAPGNSRITTRQTPEGTPVKVNVSGIHGILQKLTSPNVNYQQL